MIQKKPIHAAPHIYKEGHYDYRNTIMQLR